MKFSCTALLGLLLVGGLKGAVSVPLISGVETMPAIETPGARLVYGLPSCDGEIALSPNGRWLVTVSAEGLILWNLATSLPSKTLTGGDGGIYALCYSPSGDLLATGDYVGTVTLWNILQGKKSSEMISLRRERITALAISPREHLLVSGDIAGGVTVWDLQTKKVLQTFTSMHADAVTRVVFNPKKDQFVTASEDGMVGIWSASSGSNETMLAGHSGRVEDLAIAENGTFCSAGSDRRVIIWSPNLESPTITLPLFTNAVGAVEFARSGSLLFTGLDNGDILAWDIARATVVKRFQWHGAAIRSLQIDQGDRVMVSSSEDGAVLVWDLDTAAIRRVLKNARQSIVSVAVSQSSNVLAAGDDGGAITIWQRRGNGPFQMIKSMRESSGSVDSLVFSPDGERLVSADHNGRLLSWNWREMTFTNIGASVESPIIGISFDQSGRWLFGAQKNGRVFLMNAEAGTDVAAYHLNTTTRLMAASADGRKFTTMDEAGVGYLWRLNTDVESSVGSPKLEMSRITGKYGRVQSIALDSIGKVLIANTGSSILLWTNLTSSTELSAPRVLANPFKDTVALHLPSKSEVIAVRSGGEVSVWSLAEQPGNAFGGGVAGQSINCVKIDSNGSSVITGHADGLVVVQFRRTGRHLLRRMSDEEWVGAQQLRWDTFVRRADGGRGVFVVSSNGFWSPVPPQIPVAASNKITITVLSTPGYLSNTLSTNIQVARALENATINTGEDGMVRIRLPNKYTYVTNFTEFAPLRIERETKHLTQTNVGRLRVIDRPTGLIRFGYGLRKTYSITVSNEGPGHVYWVDLVAEDLEDSDKWSCILTRGPIPFVRGPDPDVSLNPVQEIEFQLAASGGRSNPRGWAEKLMFKLVSAHQQTVADFSLDLQLAVPIIKWHGLRLSQGGKDENLRLVLTNTVENVGLVSVPRDSIFEVSVDGRPVVVYTNDSEFAAGERLVFTGLLPPGSNPNVMHSVSLRVQSLAWPMHEWTFEDRLIQMPSTDTRVYFVSILVCMFSVVLFFYIRANQSTLVSRITRDPKLLVEMELNLLPEIRVGLNKKKRLRRILKACGVHSEWLDNAIEFLMEENELVRCELFRSRTGWFFGTGKSAGLQVFELKLPSNFQLNMESVRLVFPPNSESIENLSGKLEHTGTGTHKVTLLISTDIEFQSKLIEFSRRPANCFVTLSNRELTEFLLGESQAEVLARIIASQVRVMLFSPYQTKGGVRRESSFFGRRQILSHILGRDAANYFIVGARQSGKSSLLKALDRQYQGDESVRSHYLVLTSDEIWPRLARELGFVGAGADQVIDELRRPGPIRIFHIDECDLFIESETTNAFRALQEFRSLSEERRCFFIFAGFWKLYELAALDFQSPLKNFGEILEIGPLEEDASRELIKTPMASMNIRFASEELVDHIIQQTGRRANLIAITCNEILKAFDAGGRVIERKHVREALKSREIRNALAGWERLVPDEKLSRLDRIIVYAMINNQKFTRRDLLLKLPGDALDRKLIDQSLARLQLAFILKKLPDNAYEFRVPIFRETVLEADPEEALESELQLLNAH